MNHKRVYWLYCEEGLSLRRRKRKRLTSEGRGPGELAKGPNQVWSLDFVSDCTAPGRRLRLLTVVDTYTRESLAIEVDTSISGERVARVLDRVIAERNAQPEEIVMDNGPEMTGRAWTSGPTSGACAYASSRRASRCRTPSSRASTGACATSA